MKTLTTPPAPPSSATDRCTGWLLVIGQLVLLAVVILFPAGTTWPIPPALKGTCRAGELIGIGIMVAAAVALGRGLTATPLPNAHARLRIDGMYRFVRHPIYTGLLLFATARTIGSGNAWAAAAYGALVGLINAKARWEERHLAKRFPDYAAYRQRTPRFLPRRVRR